MIFTESVRNIFDRPSQFTEVRHFITSRIEAINSLCVALYRYYGLSIDTQEQERRQKGGKVITRFITPVVRKTEQRH
jgi:hypothetical protein